MKSGEAMGRQVPSAVAAIAMFSLVGVGSPTAGCSDAQSGDGGHGGGGSIGGVECLGTEGSNSTTGGGEGGSGMACSVQWIDCDDHNDYAVSCGATTCECRLNAAATKTFESSTFCDVNEYQQRKA